MLHKIVIWGTGLEYNGLYNLIKFFERDNQFKVVAITDGYVKDASYIDGYKFVKPEKLIEEDFDYILVCVAERFFDEVIKNIHDIGIERNRVLPGRILKIAGFDFEKYIKVKALNVSILSNNCWGGLTYHTLGLPILSPLVNMWERDGDYIKFLKNIKMYLSSPIEFIRFGYAPNQKNENYPVARCADIELHFNHVETFEEAKQQWNKRKDRINFQQLFVMMFTSDSKLLDEFDKLPFEHKVCFVPFESDVPSAFYLPNWKDVGFWYVVNRTAIEANGEYFVLDLLLGDTKKKDRWK